MISGRLRLAVLLALTAVAFGLRVRGLGEGLYGDELYTLDETRGRDFTGMLDAVANGIGGGVPLENTPPLHFVLAWLSGKVVDATSAIRLPSILLGTAVVPLAYLLGARTVGRAGALVGAALLALSPFAIFYSIEARAYSTLMFFSALSALALLAALNSGRGRWWAAYALCVAAVLYTHYSGVFVIGAQAAWSLWYHRSAWRGLALSYAGVVAAYAVWLPYINSQPANYEELAGLVGVNDWGAALQWVAGTQAFRPSELPGTLALVLLAAGAAVALVAGIYELPRRGRVPVPSAELVLVAALAAATPVGLLLYGLVGDNLFVFPRNLSASSPFLALAAGWLLARPPRPIAGLAIALACGGMAIGAVKTLDRDFQRPDFPAVAEHLDEHAGQRDLVVYYGAGFSPFIIEDVLPIYLDRPHRVTASDTSPRSVAVAFEGDRPHERVFVVELLSASDQPPPEVAEWRRRDQRVFAGAAPLAVAEYEPLRRDAYELSGRSIRRDDGTGIPIRPGRFQGAVDASDRTPQQLTLSGWAATPDWQPVDSLVAFAGARLAAVATPSRHRPGLGPGGGSSDVNLGFALAIAPGSVAAAGGQVRVFAIADEVASPLPFYCAPNAQQVVGC